MTEEPLSVSDLEARITRIEQRLAMATGAPLEPAGTGNDPHDALTLGDNPFWALNQLKGRHDVAAVLYTGHVATPDGPVEWQMTHDATALVEEDWTELASTLAALGHPSRLRILQLICRGEASTAADLAHTDGLGTTGQIYHHLRQLVAAGWLRNTTKGHHQVPPERLVPLLVILGASH